MKISVLSNNFPPEIIGGAEVYAKLLSDELSKKHDLFVFAGKYDLSMRHSSYDLESHNSGYMVYRINMGSFALDYRNPLNFFNPKIKAEYDKILELEKPDIIHAHNLAGISLAPIASAKKRWKLPIVMTLHDFWPVCPKNTLLTKTGDLCNNGGINGCDGCNIYFISPLSCISMGVRNKVVYDLCKHIDVFISPSELLRSTFKKCGYDMDIQCIKNGLDLDEYLSIQRPLNLNNKVKILMLGYIAYHKGVYVLLDAIEHLVRHGCINIELTLAGANENENKLKREIEKKGLSKFVRILGKISEEDKLNLLRDSDIFVLPSIWYENQPLTIIEAMASSLPVVGSNVGGIPEMVSDGKTGYLFERGDSEDLSAKLEILILDPKKRQVFGDSAKSVASVEYNIHKNVEKILEIYGRLI